MTQKKHGALTFEDPDLADARMGRNIRGECKWKGAEGGCDHRLFDRLLIML